MTNAADTTLILKRSFNAPVAKVYAAWVNADQFCRWMGPHPDMVCEAQRHNVTVGGEFAFVMTNPEGQKHGASGTFREVIENQKLVFTWTWDHVPERETLVTVDFDDDGTRSSMTLTHAYHTNSESRDNHRVGWTGSFDKLEKLVSA